MSEAASWYLHRLRAMSPGELVHRSYRAARYPIDQLRMRTNRYARPSRAMQTHLACWQGPEPFYFDRELCNTPASAELLAQAEAICAGKRCVLGLGWITLPPDGWHHEPRACTDWPRIDAARVRRAAPKHLDPRLTWEFNRGHEWVVLARVYAATREQHLLDRLAAELASWRRHNPIGIGINWSSAMEAAIRIHSLVWCAGLLRGTTCLLPTLAEVIYEHACFVSNHRSHYSSANNHLIVELSALVVAALTLGGELARLHAPALARMLAELDHQICADGVNAEMATHYHVFVLEAAVLVADLHRAHAMPSRRLEAVIQRMADYIEAIRCDDGSLLQQGDCDDGCIIGLLRARHTDQVLTLARTLGAGPRRERDRSRLFAASGQVILRDPRLHATFDAGPFGFGSLAAHAHCDALAISLAVDGRRVLVDRGTYRYNGDASARERYRCTAAHNTAQVGCLEQASAAGPFIWSRRPAVALERCELTPHGDIVRASHEGFAGWTHRRTLVRHRGVLAIIDELRGQAPARDVVSRYHLAPELAIATSAPGRFDVTHGGAPLAWFAANTTRTCITATPHSDEYARTTPAPTLEVAGTTDRVLIVALGPAHLPIDASISALARFAAAHGVHASIGELAASK